MKVFRSTLAYIALLCAIIALAFAPQNAVNSESHVFQTEVKRMMNIIINSLYKTKEIFLRELISNASDAIEKMRILSLKDPSMNMLDSASTFNISIHPDPANKRLIVQDNGIGMTKKDLMNNLGTIAKSGTADFMSKKHSASSEQSSLIGQFGVGFYSVFLVADTVEVYTKHPKDKQYVWRSDASSTFTIEEDSNNPEFTLEHGTRIVINLKDDLVTDFVGESKLRDHVARFSEFINFPIYLNTTKEIEIDDPDAVVEEEKKKEDEETAEANETIENEEKKEKKEGDNDDKDDDDDSISENDVTESKEKVKPKIKKTVSELQHVNVNKPVWVRDPKTMNQSDYHGFYKAVFKDTADPLRAVHFKGEGNFEFRCLVFIPERPEHSILQASPEKFLRNVRLFVRRVFITDELIDFLPRFLGFVKGIIDSDDFPLNVSRETVQNNRKLPKIRDMVVNKVIDSIHEVSSNETQYKKFYKEYAGYLKMGVMETTENKRKIKLAKLLRFASTNNRTEGAPMVSLDDYVLRMRKNQKTIYFLTGDSVAAMRKSPYIERPVSRGYEVLLMDDSLDEYMMQRFRKYGKFDLRNIAQGKFEFGDETSAEKEELENLKKRFEPLTKFLTDLLKDQVEETTISRRLTTFSCALVAPDFGWTGRFQRLMVSQNQADEGIGSFYMSQKKKFEINPDHPVMISLLAKIEADAVDNDVQDLARSLYDLALISGNYPMNDISSVTRRIENAVRLGLGVDLTSEAKVEVRPAPEVNNNIKVPTEEDEGSFGPEEEAKSNETTAEDSEDADTASPEDPSGEETQDASSSSSSPAEGEEKEAKEEESEAENDEL